MVNINVCETQHRFCKLLYLLTSVEHLNPHYLCIEHRLVIQYIGPHVEDDE